MHRQHTKLAHVKTNPTKSSQSTPTSNGFVSVLLTPRSFPLLAPCSFPLLTPRSFPLLVVSILLVAGDHHAVSHSSHVVVSTPRSSIKLRYDITLELQPTNASVLHLSNTTTLFFLSISSSEIS